MEATEMWVVKSSYNRTQIFSHLADIIFSIFYFAIADWLFFVFVHQIIFQIVDDENVICATVQYHKLIISSFYIQSKQIEVNGSSLRQGIRP